MSSSDAPATAQASQHIEGLDGLRGIAVLAVVIYHWMYFFFPDYFYLLVSGGFIGVDLFFVLSGFLITWLCLLEYERHGGISVPRFYMRRALRLLPALVFLLLVVVVIDLVQGQVREQLLAYFSVLFYFNNWMVYSTLQNTAELGHLWSLSVEEQFYILWPLLLLLILGKLQRTVALALLLSIIVAVAAYRFYLWEQGTNWLLIYLRTDLRVDALLIGALGAFAWKSGWQFPVSGKLFSMGCAVVFLILVHVLNAGEGFYYQFGALGTGLLTIAWILSCRDQQATRDSYLGWRFLQYFGTRSYGLYLWHFTVFFSLSSWSLSVPLPVLSVLGILAALLITEFSWRYVEKPFNAIRHRYSAASRPH